jgi:phosphotransferase system HPr (HPr) family protein
MTKFTYVITDENGIHARPAGMLVRFAKETPDRITVKNKDKSADATRLFAIMGLGAKKGDTLEFTVSGENCEETSARLREFCVKTL